ncbi:MAG: UDP-N-acetylmuramoyl-L-alanine--D-glutamate ligase, partial [Methylococcales bacterium]|nr:UDP-N-acetylmuramoyl-L-alanine--D-glutamate ligase [Methylococcales bacterium]
QLMTMNKCPTISVITNLSPNHLDVHKSMSEYIEAKENIWRLQTKEDYVVLNWDNPLTRAMVERVPSIPVYFSRLEEVPFGVFMRDDVFIARNFSGDEKICSTKELMLVGVHNWENVAAAAAACLIQGVAPHVIGQAVAAFKGVEHRLELVREFEGVKYYNDSIASSPTRTVAGLEAIGGDIVLIAGGYDKNVPFEALGFDIVRGVRAVALIGKTAGKIENAILEAEKELGRQVIKCHLSSLKEAVLWSKEQARPGTNILLSPACASFDMFRNFEERGRHFRAIVNSLY